MHQLMRNLTPNELIPRVYRARHALEKAERALARRRAQWNKRTIPYETLVAADEHCGEAKAAYGRALLFYDDAFRVPQYSCVCGNPTCKGPEVTP